MLSICAEALFMVRVKCGLGLSTDRSHLQQQRAKGISRYIQDKGFYVIGESRAARLKTVFVNIVVVYNSTRNN